MSRHDLVVPELGLDAPVLLSVWHVRTGAAVTEGDRVVELLCGEVTVDVPAPVSGVLAEKLVPEDQRLTTGQQLGVIET